MATDTTSHAPETTSRPPSVEPPPASVPASAPAPAAPRPAPPPEPAPAYPRGEPGGLYRLTIEQYRKMIEADIFEDDDRFELLDGLLVRKMVKNPPHEVSRHLVAEALRNVIPAAWHIRTESPTELPGGDQDADSMPEPDISLLRGAIRDYKDRTPGPGDVGLVVEVADSSLRKDRRGLARYARAGIPIVWIVNLPARSVEVYTRPTGAGPEPSYAELRTFGVESSLTLPLEGRDLGPIAVSDLLP